MGQILFEAIFLLRFPFQNRTVSEPKTYGFGTETIKDAI